MKNSLNALRLTAAATALLAAPAAMQAQQTLYVASESGIIDSVSPAGVVTTFATVGVFSYDNIFGVAFGPTGDLFAVDESTNVISKVSPDGKASPFALLPAVSEGSGIAFDTSGNLYSANFASDTISKIDPNGVVTTFVTLPSGSGPNDLAFDAGGNLYVANQTSNTVSLITPGGVVSTFAKFGKHAGSNGLAFDKNGNLYVSNYESGDIEKVTPDGTKSTFAKLGPDPEPLGLAFDKNGNLYVAVVTGIDEISPDGKTVNSFANDSDDPTFLAFGPAAVPEPSTWMVMFSGLAALGVVRRLRRSRPV